MKGSSLGDGLLALYKNRDAVCFFETKEEQIAFKINGDRPGHFEAICEAFDEAGSEHRLNLTLSFDRSYIPDMIADLEQIMEAFPIKSSPS